MYDTMPSPAPLHPAKEVAIILRTIPRLSCVWGSNELYICYFFHYTLALNQVNVQEQFQELGLDSEWYIWRNTFLHGISAKS